MGSKKAPVAKVAKKGGFEVEAASRSLPDGTGALYVRVVASPEVAS